MYTLFIKPISLHYCSHGRHFPGFCCTFSQQQKFDISNETQNNVILTSWLCSMFTVYFQTLLNFPCTWFLLCISYVLSLQTVWGHMIRHSGNILQWMTQMSKYLSSKGYYVPLRSLSHCLQLTKLNLFTMELFPLQNLEISWL